MEQRPLLTYSLEAPGLGSAPAPTARRLSTSLGVLLPTLLSMVSVVLFLRLGFVLGQAGLCEALGMLALAFLIIGFTVLSVCAISTNGVLDAGGTYYMISRALGPEFGASVGLFFFLANGGGCALYVLGLVEAIVDVFGRPPGDGPGTGVHVLIRSYWYELLYGSVLLLFCLLVCLLGAQIYARATLLIFLVVVGALGAVLISFFARGPAVVHLSVPEGNGTLAINGSFTGFKLVTLWGNLYPAYGPDYTTGLTMSFSSVFAILFNGCTGIMAGANMSGELKNPSVSIPRGTLTAVFLTFLTYSLLLLLASCTCDRLLLQKDYGFLRDINIWPPVVTLGIFFSTLSAAMSNLIGASRVLYAIAKDDLFGKILAPVKRTTCSGNPWVSVLVSWGLVQLVLFAGKLNTIAAIVTICFLMVYATVDLACLALKWASAPNFRPTFQFFSWHSCALGLLGCGAMVFLVQPLYAATSLGLWLLLLLLLRRLGVPRDWGHVSQALIFHQVRKYLLLLDTRKDHVKFWRPQVLLLVRNPRGSLALIHFVNHLKKSGLYLLGHVELQDLDSLPSDPLLAQEDSWLQLVEDLQIKAFVALTLASSVRLGAQQLLLTSGLGGMRPNTLILGFSDGSLPRDGLSGHPRAGVTRFYFPPTRGSAGGRAEAAVSPPLCPREYVALIADALKLRKNVLLARHFPELGTSRASRRAGIDVWPVDWLRPGGGLEDLGTSALFLLQMACVLSMSRAWRGVPLRLFLCMEAGPGRAYREKQVQDLLRGLRIGASVHPVPWEAAAAPSGSHRGASPDARPWHGYLEAANRLIRAQSPRPAVRFLYLPPPPPGLASYSTYLQQLDLLTRGLGPTLLGHGVSDVTSTAL
ncbi:solute carrier family 12 member 9-like [Ornithorhynchus anatinus]|uniref:Solute carrier family 12 member 9 n=1 Tax=Ornithorhynchus anatinus TaxID=9258 RepID=F6VR98_ORNAN|nr:solute carrier family 12 member 9-like [Ornithorhynchus anatinus]